MGYLFVYIIVVLIIEFIFVVTSYDDYFDNMGWSLFWGIIVTIIIAAVVEHEPCEGDCDKDEQAVMLDEQWSDTVVDDIIGSDDMIARVKNEIAERTNYVEDESNDIVVNKTQRAIPSTSSYINGSRRNYDVKVTYEADTRAACDYTGDCFRAQTVQHTDGTYWACKRNYGTCYQY